MEAFRNIFEREYTWAEGFMRNVRRFGDKSAMYCLDTDEEWSYSALNREANRLAAALTAISFICVKSQPSASTLIAGSFPVSRTIILPSLPSSA